MVSWGNTKWQMVSVDWKWRTSFLVSNESEACGHVCFEHIIYILSSDWTDIFSRCQNLHFFSCLSLSSSRMVKSLTFLSSVSSALLGQRTFAQRWNLSQLHHIVLGDWMFFKDQVKMNGFASSFSVYVFEPLTVQRMDVVRFLLGLNSG